MVGFMDPESFQSECWTFQWHTVKEPRCENEVSRAHCAPHIENGSDPLAPPTTLGANIAVDTKKIRFVKNKPWLDENSASKPGPIVKTLPDWYTRAEWFVPNPDTGKPAEAADGSGKMPTWKACPAVLDVLGTGYTYKTPCDIEFAEDAQGNIHGRVLDARYKSFLQDRDPMPQFFHPRGYHMKHFAWWADWAVELPEGYSALYAHPLNRF